MPQKSVASKISKSKTKPGIKTKLTVLPGGKLNNFLNSFSEKIINLKSSKTIYIAAIMAVLLPLFIYKKNWFIAAAINGSPLLNLDLQTRLNQQFRSQTLNQLINEKIILDEAAKNNAIPSVAEINEKISEVETSVGGSTALTSLLTQQGQDKDMLKQQIKLQLAIEKLYSKAATVSAQEIAKFIEENQNQMRATDSAAQKEEAQTAIINQKLSQIFSQKFQELRSKAKIQIF